MTTDIKLTTAEELYALPDDGFRYELLKGEIRKMAPAGSEHGRIAVKLTVSLGHFVETHDLGVVFAAETGFRIGTDPDTVRAPDVAFVGKDRVQQAGNVQGYWPGAPDLAMEVVSPGDKYGEVEDKVFDWLAAGTKAVIVVNPRKRVVTVFRSLSDIRVLTEHDTLAVDDVVPGWSILIARIFA